MELAAGMHIKKKVNKANSRDMLVLLCFMQPLAWQSFFLRFNRKSAVKDSALGLPWWSSGQDSILPIQETWVRDPVRELRYHTPYCPPPDKKKKERILAWGEKRRFILKDCTWVGVFVIFSGFRGWECSCSSSNFIILWKSSPDSLFCSKSVLVSYWLTIFVFG